MGREIPLACDPEPDPPHPFILQTWNCYARLMQQPALSAVSARQSLGGRLLWAGELDATGNALTVAGNVAGAATLAAASDANAQRHAVRDGIVDFLVNSLDEAVRILKNEIRKEATVAVCVSASPSAVEEEMRERGVQPDVLRASVLGPGEPRDVAEMPPVPPLTAPHQPVQVVWTVDRAPVMWLPKIDAIALQCLPPEQNIARRWVERSSRYLGRIGHSGHLVVGDQQFAAAFVRDIRRMRDAGEFEFGCRIEIVTANGSEIVNFTAPAAVDKPRQS